MLRFDPNLRWMFTELPMLQRFEAAAKAGFKGVELAFPYEYPANQIAELLGRLELTLVQILTPCDWDAGERGIAALPGREAAFRDSVKVAAEYALQVGRPLIHAMAGNLPAGTRREDCTGVLLENLSWAADLLAPDGLTLILEPCCRARFPDFYYHRIDEGIEVLRLLNRDNVKLCYDTFHVQSEEGNLVETLRRAFPDIGHVQIGNVPGRHEPGVGEIHFPYLFEQLEVLGWTGWVGCEYAPASGTLESLAWGAGYGIRASR